MISTKDVGKTTWPWYGQIGLERGAGGLLVKLYMDIMIMQEISCYANMISTESEAIL